MTNDSPTLGLHRPLPTLAAFAGLVTLGAGSRLLELPANIAAVAAVGLLAGAIFRSRVLAALVPLTAMIVSDLFLGGYAPAVMVSVYAMMLVPVLMGRGLQRRPSLLAVGGAAIVSALAFFLVTNFAVWATGGGLAFPKTFAGLVECYAAAIPFFRMSVLGDVGFALTLFGAREVVTLHAQHRRLAMA